MIHRLVAFALRKRVVILVMTLVLIVAGIISFKNLPIEAYPDIADTWVQVITQWEGHAAEEVERQITVPLEIALNGVPHRTTGRSVSLPGLSQVTLLFDEQTAPFLARQYVLEKLTGVPMPSGV